MAEVDMAAPQIPAYSAKSQSSGAMATVVVSGIDTETNIFSVPHNFASFLERSLAWRSGLPPSAGQGLYDLYSKTATNDAPSLRGRPRRREDSIEDLLCSMHDFLKSTVWANHDMLALRPSQLNGPQQKAVFVKGSGGTVSATPDPSLPAWLRPTNGEHVHIHPDGTSHMLLSLADAATAIETGWAESYTKVTTENSLPLGYVTVHAPRNTTELTEWKRLVLASVRFCTHSPDGFRVRRPERL